MRVKLLYLIVFAFLVILGFGLWFWQRNSFSKEVLKLEILASENVDVGQEIVYAVKYKNNGDITLTDAKLTFEYPENFLGGENKARVEKALEDIYPGKEETFNFKARAFGKEGEFGKAQAWLDFQPKNLKARYEVSTSQTATIKFSPLTFELDLPSRIEPEKDFTFSLNYFSNIDYPLSKLGIKIEYPTGFEFIESTPQSLDKNEWDVALLNKAQGGRIRVTGRITGDIGEQKVFKASLGIWQDNGNFVLLKEMSKAFEIIRPSIYLSQLVNGQLDYIANPGEVLHYEIFFKNIGNSPFENLFLVVGLQGSLFDLDTVRAEGSTPSQQSNSLVWDWKKNSQLKFLDENEEGKVDIWVNLKDDLSNSQDLGQNMILKDTISLSPVSQEFTVKVNSKLSLSRQVFYNDEVFGNSGNLPPLVGQPTTYTIMWKLNNLYNNLRDVKVKAVLPSWASLTGQVFPRDASFAFDSQSREIIWTVGDLAAWQNADLSFQVSFTPSYLQRGLSPEICGKIQGSGEDVWTQETLTVEAGGVNTSSLSDPEFVSSQGIVQ